MTDSTTEGLAEWLTYAEAAVYLRISKTTLRAWMDAGRLVGREEAPQVQAASVVAEADRRRQAVVADEGWLPVADVADRLRVADGAIRMQIRQGNLIAREASDGSRRKLISEESLTRWLEEGPG